MRACCVICGDSFVEGVDVSAVHCGHTFHTVCILQWFESSKTCPQCRTKTSDKKLVKLYFDVAEDDDSVHKNDPTTLKHLLDNAKFELKLKEQEILNLKQDVTKNKSHNDELREEVKKRHEEQKDQAALICSLEAQLRLQSSLKNKVDKMKAERDSAVSCMKSMQELQVLLSGTEKEVEQILTDYSASENEAARSLSNVCVLLKRELRTVSEKKRSYAVELRQLKNTLNMKKQEALGLNSANKALQEKVSLQKSDIKRLEEENSNLSKKLSALEMAVNSPSCNDVAKGALKRLLQENLTPQNLKRYHGMSLEDSCTPEIVRKVPRIEASVSLNDSTDMFADEETGTSTKTKDTSDVLHQYKLNMTTHASPSSDSPYLKVKSNTLLPGPVLNKKASFSRHGSISNKVNQMATKPGFDYDGLGGHHRADPFPKPVPVIMKKRSVSKPVKINTVSGGSFKSKTITNFFKSTFED